MLVASLLRAMVAQREPVERQRRPRHVAQDVLESLPITAVDRDLRVHHVLGVLGSLRSLCARSPRGVRRRTPRARAPRDARRRPWAQRSRAPKEREGARARGLRRGACAMAIGINPLECRG